MPSTNNLLIMRLLLDFVIAYLILLFLYIVMVPILFIRCYMWMTLFLLLPLMCLVSLLCFAMKDLGPLNYFLRNAVTRTPTGLFLSQQKYATKILDKAHLANFVLMMVLLMTILRCIVVY